MKTCLISMLILELYRPLCIARVSVGIVSNWMLENAQKSRFSGNYHHSFFHFHSWRFCSLLSPPVCIIFLVCLFLQHYIYTWSVKSHMNVLLSSCTYGQSRYISLDYSIILYCNSIAAKRGGFKDTYLNLFHIADELSLFFCIAACCLPPPCLQTGNLGTIILKAW